MRSDALRRSSRGRWRTAVGAGHSLHLHASHRARQANGGAPASVCRSRSEKSESQENQMGLHARWVPFCHTPSLYFRFPNRPVCERDSVFQKIFRSGDSRYAGHSLSHDSPRAVRQARPPGQARGRAAWRPPEEAARRAGPGGKSGIAIVCQPVARAGAGDEVNDAGAHGELCRSAALVGLVAQDSGASHRAVWPGGSFRSS
jgi:hypothetical protein